MTARARRVPECIQNLAASSKEHAPFFLAFSHPVYTIDKIQKNQNTENTQEYRNTEYRNTGIQNTVYSTLYHALPRIRCAHRLLQCARSEHGSGSGEGDNARIGFRLIILGLRAAQCATAAVKCREREANLPCRGFEAHRVSPPSRYKGFSVSERLRGRVRGAPAASSDATLRYITSVRNRYLQPEPTSSPSW